MRGAWLLALVLLCGCVSQPFCSSARASFEGTHDGWLDGIAPPPKWQATTPLDGPSWTQHGVDIHAPLESGRPQDLQSAPEALWFGLHDGGALFEDGDMRVFAHDAEARDRVLDAAHEASAGIDAGPWSPGGTDEPPHWWDFALPDDFPRTSWTARAAMPEPKATDHLARHEGWYGWAISPERTLRAQAEAHFEVHVSSERFTAQVHADEATEAELRAMLEQFAGRFGATVDVDDSRYRPRECSAEPPET